MTNDIFAYLLENTLTIAILFGGVMLIKKLYHRRLSAVMHYALWGIVVLKLLIPVGIASEASPWNLFSSPQTAVTEVAEAETDSTTAPEQNTVWNDYRRFVPADSAYQAGGAAAADTNKQTAPSQTIPQQAPVVPIVIDWPSLILILWAGGFCFTGAWLIVGKMHIQRQIERTKTANPPAWMSNMVDGCRAVLRIDRPIGIVLQKTLPVPAIMGIFKPKLVLPAHLAEEGDKKQLRHIFFHELMHYKRRDLIVIGLLNALSAVYWFNPIVWLLVKFVRKDMETACDSNVLSAMGEHRRQDYIFTLVKFTGKSNHCRVQAALSLNDGKSGMKKRIAGMFLHSKTKSSVKIPVILLVLVMAFACFTTACQPTPEKPVVVAKGDLEEKITEAPANSPQTVTTSEKIVKSMSKGKLNIEVNATVNVPKADKFPVVKTEPIGFTQEQADKIISVLMQGKPIYDPPEQQTKAELQRQLVYYKAMAESFTNAAAAAGVKKMDNAIADLEKRIAEAPEKVDLKPATGKFEERVEKWDGKIGYEGREIQAVAELGQEYRAQLFINCSKSKKMSSVWFTHQDTFNFYQTYNSLPDGTIAGLKISRNDAKALAEKTVSDMGCDLKLSTVRLAPQNSRMDNAPNKQAYAFFFTREVNGVPTTYDVNDGSMLDAPEDKKDLQYYEPYPAEQLYMIIDDTGIVELQWVSPSKLTETVSENAAILNADEAMGRFEQQFFIKHAPKTKDQANPEDVKNGMITDEDIKRSDYTIDRITLGMMRIPVKDKQGEYMLVPVWDFYGSEKITYNKPVQDITKGDKGKMITEQTIDHSVMSLLTINAIDGSVINRVGGGLG